MIDFSDYPELCSGDDLAGDYTDATILQACDLVRGECGWHLAPTMTEVLRLDSAGGRLLALPSLRVREVISVTTADDVPIEDWELSENGLLERKGRDWPVARRLKVELEHGFAAVPPALIPVIEDAALNITPEVSASASLKEVELDDAIITYRDNVIRGIQRDLQEAYGHVLGRYSL